MKLKDFDYDKFLHVEDEFSENLQENFSEEEKEYHLDQMQKYDNYVGNAMYVPNFEKQAIIKNIERTFKEIAAHQGGEVSVVNPPSLDASAVDLVVNKLFLADKKIFAKIKEILFGVDSLELTLSMDGTDRLLCDCNVRDAWNIIGKPRLSTEQFDLNEDDLTMPPFVLMSQDEAEELIEANLSGNNAHPVHYGDNAVSLANAYSLLDMGTDVDYGDLATSGESAGRGGVSDIMITENGIGFFMFKIFSMDIVPERRTLLDKNAFLADDIIDAFDGVSAIELSMGQDGMVTGKVAFENVAIVPTEI